MAVLPKPPYQNKVTDSKGHMDKGWLAYFTGMANHLISGWVSSITGVANRIKITGTASAPIVDIDPAYVASAAQGGTGQNAYTLGDTIYASGPAALSRLPGSTQTSPLVMTQTGTGSASAPPAWMTRSQLLSVFNVLDYGAQAAPGVDASPAFQAALNAAGAAGVAEVFVPGGLTFHLYSTITIPSGVHLRGQGRRLSGLLFHTTAGAASISFANGYYQTISDLNIDHNSYAASGPAILFQDNDGVGGTDPAQYSNCRDLRIVNHQTGVRCNAESTWLTFTDVNVESCGTAYSISLANLSEFHRCIANGNVTAWFLDRTAKCTLRHCTAQVCSSTTIPAIQIVDADNTVIDNLWCERNEFTNVLIKGSGLGPTPQSRLTVIKDCRLSGAGYTSGAGQGLDIGANSIKTTVYGGWYGSNAGNDIRINAGSTENVIIAPKVSTGTVTISDSAADTTYFGDAKVQVYTQALLRGGALITGGDLKLGTAGLGIYIKEGTNACMGVAALVAGTVVVSTTKVTANSRIQLTIQSLGTVTAPKAIGVTARTAGTSFTITSADATDTSVIAWEIKEPA